MKHVDKKKLPGIEYILHSPDFRKGLWVVMCRDGKTVHAGRCFESKEGAAMFNDRIEDLKRDPKNNMINCFPHRMVKYLPDSEGAA